MTTFIETLNHWGNHYLNFAWPVVWQSSLLIAVIFVLEFTLRRKVRAAIRYAFWLMVLVKLLLPPSLALPTSPTWWIHSAVLPSAKAPPVSFTVTYGEQMASDFPLPPSPVISPPRAPAMSFAAWILAATGVVSAGLLAWLFVRWRQINQKVRGANTSEKLIPVLDEVRHLTRLRPGIRLKLTENSMSPAVCGLFRPVILLPQSLVEKLSAGQLRAVLLHEAIHLRRGDVWVNCAQALLQIVFWWHPLLWLANARIRRVREEAVDDAVMLALRDDAEIYAPTLLEVAKFAFRRPLASLGLVGILESRSALRQRIERLMNFNAPKNAGLTAGAILGILAFSTVALPMGQAPEKVTTRNVSSADNLPNRVISSQNQLTQIFQIERLTKEDDLKQFLSDAGVKIPPTIFYYEDNGILLVRGTTEQLALVYRVVLGLNGVPPKDSEKIVINFVRKAPAMANVNLAATNLEMRVFKVDPHQFQASLRKIPGQQTNNVATMAEALFNKLGVDLTTPGRSIAFNDRLGLLFVKDTPAELDTIERIIQALNQTNPQIHIKARFIEVPKKGFVMPQLFSNAVAGPMTGILTDPEFRTMLQALEHQKGAETLAEPECITTSGRQTQMRATEMFDFSTNFPPQNGPINSTSSIPQEEVAIGPSVDVVPYVLSDGYTIYLTTIVSVNELVTYKYPTSSTRAVPGLTVQNAATTVNLWDGQTLVLGNLKKDFVKINGQVSNESKRFQDVVKRSGTADKELLVFITATIVDPAGNRVHSDADLPFNPNTIPQQPTPTPSR